MGTECGLLKDKQACDGANSYMGCQWMGSLFKPCGSFETNIFACPLDRCDANMTAKTCSPKKDLATCPSFETNIKSCPTPRCVADLTVGSCLDAPTPQYEPGATVMPNDVQIFDIIN